VSNDHAVSLPESVAFSVRFNMRPGSPTAMFTEDWLAETLGKAVAKKLHGALVDSIDVDLVDDAGLT
jgi:hypothetical protein